MWNNLCFQLNCGQINSVFVKMSSVPEVCKKKKKGKQMFLDGYLSPDLLERKNGVCKGGGPICCDQRQF